MYLNFVFISLQYIAHLSGISSHKFSSNATGACMSNSTNLTIFRSFVKSCLTCPVLRHSLRQVDARTRQGLRRLGVYVTEEWLWKLGAARFSAFRRPSIDELDTVQLMRDLQSRHMSFRSATSATPADPGRNKDFWPFVLAVNEVGQMSVRLSRMFIWYRVHQPGGGRLKL